MDNSLVEHADKRFKKDFRYKSINEKQLRKKTPKYQDQYRPYSRQTAVV